jgi:hypothetical protein
MQDRQKWSAAAAHGGTILESEPTYYLAITAYALAIVYYLLGLYRHYQGSFTVFPLLGILKK